MEFEMDPSAEIRIMCVDDHPLMHKGISALIQSQPDMTIVGAVSKAGDALATFREKVPDITLMDLRLPDGNGIDTMISILKEHPKARIIILTMFEGDVEIQRALKSGACGYILKNMPPEDLLQVIRKVHSGEKKRLHPVIAATLADHFGEENLTSRETEVLQLISEGNSNKEVGNRLSISEETVKGHVKNILGKLGANDRTQAVSIAVRRGIISLD
uniref:Two component transcriptional regulator n=1 Tax=uncultured bacterium BLR5 TaxID=506522 RepID=C0INV4_9BACT|nr:two component transcriptional regulator [uncultured bacterium BLR5]